MEHLGEWILNFLLGFLRDYWMTLLPWPVLHFIADPIFRRMDARMRLEEEEMRRRKAIEESAELKRAGSSLDPSHAD
ncbi:hypothetical protein [Caballeronia sp. BR00000012568055]|uniref:hypothetical protein n=1 Tax=Caballeronia sp. BR00000012568055 TaxID=2918761 RepID=UPI0023F835E6|nr:hypothetical protein [Caballeronia sp. BR00000012568055]